MMMMMMVNVTYGNNDHDQSVKAPQIISNVFHFHPWMVFKNDIPSLLNCIVQPFFQCHTIYFHDHGRYIIIGLVYGQFTGMPLDFHGKNHCFGWTIPQPIHWYKPWYMTMVMVGLLVIYTNSNGYGWIPSFHNITMAMTISKSSIL